MENTHGKEIDLSRTTVKIPGIPFRQVGGRITSNGLLRNQLIDANTGEVCIHLGSSRVLFY